MMTVLAFFFLLVSFANCGPYLGCFSDNPSKSPRDLSVPLSDGPYSVNQCISQCTSLGYFYAGLQNGGECYCGNAYGQYCLGLLTSCKTPCTKNSTEICGGSMYSSVYQAAPGGPGQSTTCSCVNPNGCSTVTAVTSVFGCATAQDASTIDFSLNVNGGVGSIKYSVNNNTFTTNMFYSVASEGNYTVTAVDSLGASFTSTINVGPAKRVSVVAVPYVPYGTLAGYRTTSIGVADATLSAVAGNGTAPYKYTLYPAGSNVAFTGSSVGAFSALAVGTYNLIATDANGCRSTPVPIVVNGPSVASPPSVINVSDVNVNQKPITSVSWLVPDFNGYTPILKYSVLLGYWDGNNIVWTANTTVTTNFTSIPDVMNDSTRRFVSIATINAVGTGPYNTVEFQGMCAAGRFANASACQDCLPGTNTLANIGKFVCRPCAAGTFSGTAAPTCAACTGNTFSGSGASSCTPCSAGYITGSYYCQPCGPGTFNVGNATTCTQCPTNTYASQPASSSCIACPPGTTSKPGSSQCLDSTGYKK